MQPYPLLSPQIVESASQRLIDTAAAYGDAAQREAARLATRLSPDLWPLEWHLPFWLGQDFGLAETVWQQLVTVNLLGMAHVRLEDDVADEALDEERLAAKALLGRRFLHASTDLLQRLFDRDERFWDRYSTYLDQWQWAAQDEESWRVGRRERIADDWQWLAWRGAPAKITASGACLLAGRAAAIDPLERCIDHAMAATVLLDHADDWPEDLANDRYNAYVAWLSGLPQRPAAAAENRRRVLAALMQGDAASHRAYFQLVDAHLAEAQQAAGFVSSRGLNAYLATLRRNAQNQSAGQAAAARQALQDALTSLLAGAHSP